MSFLRTGKRNAQHSPTKRLINGGATRQQKRVMKQIGEMKYLYEAIIDTLTVETTVQALLKMEQPIDGIIEIAESIKFNHNLNSLDEEAMAMVINKVVNAIISLDEEAEQPYNNEQDD